MKPPDFIVRLPRSLQANMHHLKGLETPNAHLCCIMYLNRYHGTRCNQSTCLKINSKIGSFFKIDLIDVDCTCINHLVEVVNTVFSIDFCWLLTIVIDKWFLWLMNIILSYNYCQLKSSNGYVLEAWKMMGMWIPTHSTNQIPTWHFLTLKRFYLTGL